MKKTLAALMMAAAVVVTSLTAFAAETEDQNEKYGQEHTPGQSVEILLDEETDASDLKVTNKLTSGKDAVESITVGKNDDGKDALILKLKETYETKAANIAGDIQLRNKNTNAVVKTYSFDFTAQWKKAEIDADAELEIVLNNDAPVYDFASSNKNVTFSFSDVDAYYNVRLEDQSAVNMHYTTKAIKAIVQANEDADLSFLQFNGNPTFDFNGTLTYNVSDMDKTWYLYEVNSEEKLVKTKAEYDKEEGTLTLKTKALSSYVISDKELKTVAASDSTTESDKTQNPATGSVDFVNVAVALSVVSLVAAGAVAMKKAK
ncbi:MAG: hypothetical protein PHE47_09480 [Oscillospiraceae bacterium]|nr:hypothetical protein [Oscillospiraceae bacterium]